MVTPYNISVLKSFLGVVLEQVMGPQCDRAIPEFLCSQCLCFSRKFWAEKQEEKLFVCLVVLNTGPKGYSASICTLKTERKQERPGQIGELRTSRVERKGSFVAIQKMLETLGLITGEKDLFFKTMVKGHLCF